MEYSIRQVSEKTKLKAHVLRYYESEGLLPLVNRSERGARRYSEDDLEWLGLICCLKNTGMSIKQIKDFVELSMQGEETLKQRCDMLIGHKKNVEAQIEEMQKHLLKVEHKIEHFTAQYEKYAADNSRDRKPELKNILISHSSAYPEMELSDYIKLIYQNEFGSGHMISNLSDSEMFLKSEYEAVSAETDIRENFRLIEPIGNGLSRIHLNQPHLQSKDLPLLNLLFAATANTHRGSISRFRDKSSLLHEMAVKNLLPLKAETVKSYLREYFSKGCPPIHHSEAYRIKYHPHYRVIKTDYAFYLPVFQAIQRLRDGGRPIIIAIDGRCGSGKSMLADRLSEVFTCNVFHMDDFFLPVHLRTKERLSQPGGNIDYERFMREVLEPLAKGRDVCFQPFDCATGELKQPVYKPAHFISVVEGSYSLHPALTKHYDFRIFLTCSPEMQKQRLLCREGQDMLKRFLKEWIPLEEYYFNACSVKQVCDLELDTTNFGSI